MKPVGLPDPAHRTRGLRRRAAPAGQPRGDHYSLVGFQTQMKWGEQARVLRLIPGLENAEFVRFGMIHRNTYINGPTVLRDTWQMRGRDDSVLRRADLRRRGLRRVGGLGADRRPQRRARSRRAASRSAPPRTTAIGALAYYVSHADPKHYQPTNITFGIIPPLDARTGRPRSAEEEGGAQRAALAAGAGGPQAWLAIPSRRP